MRKKFRVYWTDIAKNDLEEIVEYIAKDSINKALTIFKKIKKRCETLSYNPLRCRIIPELLTINICTYRELIINPYRIVFRVERNYVYILGVFDGRCSLEDILINRLVRV